MKTHALASSFVLTVALLPAVAAAQPSAPAQPLRVERVESGFVVAPEARFTSVNDQFATLAGVSGGWLTDRTLLIGGAGYWLANRDDDFKMQYGGGLVRWTIGGHRRAGVSFGALVGLGSATLARPYSDLFDPGDPHVAPRPNDRRFGRTIDPSTPIRLSDDFFIVEPQVNAVLDFTPWMRLDLGASYRGVAGASVLDHELRGVSGLVALQFGGR